jgi:hemoglobin
MVTLYQRLGDENLQLLIDRFYELVFADTRINHLFKTDRELVKSKQYKFLTQFLGGPSRYSDEYGHPRMRLRHMPHAIDKDAAFAWLECMAKAISTLPIDEGLKDEVFSRFPPVASHMVNS